MTTDVGGGCHLKFCEHEALEGTSSQFPHETLCVMWSVRCLKHHHEQRVSEGRLDHFHASIHTPSGDCAEDLLVLRVLFLEEKDCIPSLPDACMHSLRRDWSCGRPDFCFRSMLFPCPWRNGNVSRACYSNPYHPPHHQRDDTHKHECIRPSFHDLSHGNLNN